MGINPTDAAAHQAMPLDQRQHLIMAGYRHMRQASQKGQHFRAASQGTAGQFADDERVAFDFISIQE